MSYFILFILLATPAVQAQIQSSPIQGTQQITPSTYYELSQEAERLYQQGNYPKAAEAFEKLTKAYPLEGQHWYRLAFLLYRLEKFREAIQAFIKADEFGHPIASQYYAPYIARSYARLGDVENALIWLEKAVRQRRYKLKTSLLNDPAFHSLKHNLHFLELVGALPKRDFTRDEGWRYDVDYLMAEIKRVNPVYNKQPLPVELVRASNQLKAKIPKLSNEQILLELQHLLTLLKQTHNGLYPSGQEKLFKLTQLPLTFYVFPEGLYIVDAAQPYEDLIGARVLRFDETTAERAMEAVKYVISRENEMQILWEGPERLRTVQLLHALKITKNPARVNLTLIDRQGVTRTVNPEPIAVSDEQKLKAPRISNLPPPPLYLSRPLDNYWFEYLQKDKTLYLQFNQVRNKQNEESLAQFGLRVRDFLTKNEVRNLIVDVRRNNGGTTEFYTELLRTIIGFDAKRENRLFVIIGRNTFSAASNFITDVDRLTNAVFVGEPSSGKPLMVGGDEASIILPHSGIGGAIASTSWQLTFPGDTRPWITPDIPVPLTAQDYFANRDTVMETLLTILRKDINQ